MGVDSECVGGGGFRQLSEGRCGNPRGDSRVLLGRERVGSLPGSASLERKVKRECEMNGDDVSVYWLRCYLGEDPSKIL